MQLELLFTIRASKQTSGFAQDWVYRISVQKDYYTHRIIKNLNPIVEFTRVDKSSEVRNLLKKKFFILFSMFSFSSSLQIQRGK